MSELSIRAVVFKEGEHWVAQCLEYRYAIQSRRLEDIPRVLRECLEAMIHVSLETGIEPFHGYKPSPKRYWDMYDHAEPFPDFIATWQDESPSPGLGWDEILAPSIVRNVCSLFDIPFKDFGLDAEEDTGRSDVPALTPGPSPDRPPEPPGEGRETPGSVLAIQCSLDSLVSLLSCRPSEKLSP
jgi:hypothetical protein